jgi:heme exporter protein D
MYFDSLQAVIEMEGHGAFVWSAYAITLAVLLIMLLAPRRRSREQLRRLAGELRRQQGAPSNAEET